ncbi:TonB-dependent receptor [Brenneria nigrifluens]|uniref:Outer membrane receptor protein n=1 Tax=Brenneria nigrifluens DSM 30175 = ATCC 13028 TaxID=1121120 RepID=A0A2U1ULV3_9GAMM|nr:outer membrane receptor protein [Brenneria nigrifluens DSM 30175 = ATCC 13028]QCR07077.1 TonB-dependent receptor [Brenneria nigrifluens] [Brenneria nigrifluens DSM 30175 = ATCC 13028]
MDAVRLFSGCAVATAVLLHASAFAESPAAVKPISSNLGQTCTQNAYGVENPLDALRCGSVHGSLRTLYYSTKNAYFVRDNNQDTASYGGNILFQTAPYYGISAGIGGIYQQQWRSPGAGRGVTELATNQNGVGEAWLRWQYQDFRFTAGDQRIDIPFMSDYDWRITPILFRAVDMHWGDKTDFLHATKVYRYKPWRSDKFLATSSYSAIKEETNGAWAVGAGRSKQAGDITLSGQLWYESYDDYVNIFYSEAHSQWKAAPWQPDIGVQFIRGSGQGERLRGEADNTSYGVQLALTPGSKVKWSINYSHMVSNPEAYLNGALVTPYSSSTSSGKYFAQPYFTSTQDLGTGNAYSTRITYQIMPALSIGTYYSFMDLKSSAAASSRNQSEYVVFGIYQFGGALKGLSLSNFFGVQTSPLYDYAFWQNRLGLQYNF